jgi:hypothetical protein
MVVVGAEEATETGDSPADGSRGYSRKDFGACNTESGYRVVAALAVSDKQEAVPFHRA